MRAGELRCRLGIDRPDVSQNETGEEIIDWHNMGQIWARIRPLSGREALQLNINLAVMDTRINIRWSPSTDQISPKWRLHRRNKYFDVKSIAHVDMGQREIEILAKSGATEG